MPKGVVRGKIPLTNLDNRIAQHIFYVPSAAGRPASHMSERRGTGLQDSDGARQTHRRRRQAEGSKILASSPKVERDKTVATKEGAPERSSGGRAAHEAECTAGRCVPIDGESRQVRGVVDKYEPRND